MSAMPAHAESPRQQGALRLVEAHQVRAAIAIAGLLVGIGGGILLATSGHLVHPRAYGAELAVLVPATVLIALYWVVARPGNRIALVLLAYAASLAVISLQGAASPLLHSIGVLFDAPTFFLGYYIVFIFPEGRMAGVLEKVLLAGTAGVLLLGFLPSFFFSPVVSGAAPLAGCNASCPKNVLMIADRPGIADGLGDTEEYLAVALAAAIVVGLGYRLLTSSAPRRRALLPVYVPALLLAIPFGIFHAEKVGLVSLGPDSFDRIGWILTAGRISLSFGPLLAILGAIVFAGVALKRILGRLGGEEDAGHLRDLVAEALDDPSLQLAFAVGRGSGSFIDSRGEPIDPSRAPAGQSRTGLERRGETVAYMLHDAALDTDPELVQAAGQSVLLALESGRLEAELQSRIDELRISRGRIVAASEAERRRIERDLHDGAQQRLMAIQVKLALARDSAQREGLAQQLADIQADASEAVEELRALAHGIYPAVLLERGLSDALHSVAMTAPIPIDVVDRGIGRCPQAIEASIYFCSLEAIQNTIKHAGPGAGVTVTLGRDRGDICFEIADDGVGMEARSTADGVGFVSMHDRIGALGGELEITSTRGRGTWVRGTVPDDGNSRRSRSEGAS